MWKIPHCSIFLLFGQQQRIELLLIWLRLDGLFLPDEFVKKLVLLYEFLKRCLVTLDYCFYCAVIRIEVN